MGWRTVFKIMFENTIIFQRSSWLLQYCPRILGLVPSLHSSTDPDPDPRTKGTLPPHLRKFPYMASDGVMSMTDPYSEWPRPGYITITRATVVARSLNFGSVSVLFLSRYCNFPIGFAKLRRTKSLCTRLFSGRLFWRCSNFEVFFVIGNE